VAIQFFAGESSSRQRLRRLFSCTLLVIVLALLAIGWLAVERVEQIDVAEGEVARFAIPRGERRPTCPCDPAASNQECLASLTANQALIDRCWSSDATKKVHRALGVTYLLLAIGFGALIGLLLLRRVAKQQAAQRKRSRARRQAARAGPSPATATEPSPPATALATPAPEPPPDPSPSPDRPPSAG
jgi:hypothetical protein